MRLNGENSRRIDTFRQKGQTYGEIGDKLGKSKSRIWREYKRFPFVYSSKRAYYYFRMKEAAGARGAKWIIIPGYLIL
jgi:IS30 family transposase